MRHLGLLSCVLCFVLSLPAQFAVSLADVANPNAVNSNLKIGNAYSIVEMKVDVSIAHHLADVSIAQYIKNETDRDLEVEVFFPLPKDAIIQNFVMMVDGKEVAGQILDKNEARSIYEGIVRQKRDPALMEYINQGLYKTSIFPMRMGEERKITMRYSQICDKKHDVVYFEYPLATQKFSVKPLRKLSFNLNLSADEPIKNLYSPLSGVQINQPHDKHATVFWEIVNAVPTQDFQFSYALQEGKVGATVLSYKPNQQEDGYFMLVASPSMEQENDETRKNIVFVLDKSGSMAGEKIAQSKKALEYVVAHLREGDRFNIVDYDDRINAFAAEMQIYSSARLEEIKTYINRINDGGGTNINEALVTALSYIKSEERPNYLIFLTDGLPTSGVTAELDIAKNVAQANRFKTRIFSFGVGIDVNARLLERLSSANGGLVTYVAPGANIESAVSSLYKSISSPVMTDISIRFNSAMINSTYPDKIPDLFKGSQLIWVGRYNNAGNNKLTIEGRIGQKLQKLEFDVRLADVGEMPSNSFVEKIWASRRVGYLIEQIDLNGQQKEWVDELVRLSKQYGILTPFTSFLAREDVNILDEVSINQNGANNLEKLQEVSGVQANEMRKSKQAYASADKLEAPAAIQVVEEDAKPIVKKMGAKTFYKRNEKWIDGELKSSDLKSVINLKRYSASYFDLNKQLNAEDLKVLTLDGVVVVKLNGKVYEITD